MSPSKNAETFLIVDVRPFEGLSKRLSMVISYEIKKGFTAVERKATVMKKNKDLNDSSSDGGVDQSEEGECCADCEAGQCECAGSGSENSISEGSSSSEDDLRQRI